MYKSDSFIQPILFLSVCVGFCLIIGTLLGFHSESVVPTLIALVVTGFLVFIATPFAFYAMLVCWPFSFRYILPAQTEVQTPTEPLLGMLVLTFAFKQLLDSVLMGRKSVFRDDAQNRTRFPLGLPVLFYAFAIILPTFNAPQLYVSAKGVFRTVIYIMLSFVTYEVIRNRRDLRYLFVATFPSAAAAVVWTSIVLIYRIDQWQWTSAYYGSPFTNYTSYGAFTAVFLLIILSCLLSGRTSYDRVLWTGLLLIFGVGFILCFSRGVWIAMIMGVGFLFMQLGGGEQHKKILFVGAVGVFGLVLFTVPGVSELIRERISTIFDFQFASNRSRLLRWGQAFLMFLRHPIIGNGYGTFAMSYEEDSALVGEYTAQFQLDAHSQYLQVLAELGIVGLVAWMWVIISFFRYGLRALRQIADPFYRSLIVGLMAAEFSMLVLFIVFSLPTGDELAVPFWLIYGLLPAVVQMANKRHPAIASH